MKPKISVIIPVYNVEEYLNECLDSIVNQTIKDIEIICVDDGSTDNSLSILNEYLSKDERFLVITQKNLGPSVSRNKGIDSAKGDYITFIDSDDYLLNNDYLEKLYNACEKHNADIAVASIVRGKEKKVKPFLNIDKEEVTTEYKEKLKICDVPELNYVWNKLYRKSSWMSAGLRFPEGMYYEDTWLTHKILFYTGKLVGVPKITYFYRMRMKSIIHTKSMEYLKDLHIADEEMYKFFNEHNIDVSDLKKVIKKYKLFGLTLYKTITQHNKCRNILFNCITWNS